MNTALEQLRLRTAKARVAGDIADDHATLFGNHLLRQWVVVYFQPIRAAPTWASVVVGLEREQYGRADDE